MLFQLSQREPRNPGMREDHVLAFVDVREQVEELRRIVGSYPVPSPYDVNRLEVDLPVVPLHAKDL